MKRLFVVLICLGLVGCATTEQIGTKPTGDVVTQTSGSLDMTSYKKFTVAYTSQAGSPEALRDSAFLRNIAYRFEQEGLKYTQNPQDSDVIIVMTFLDAHGQKYVPPVTYTSVSYDSNTTGTVNAYGISAGNYMTVNATVDAQTTGTGTAVTHVEGGYYLPTYGVGIALDIYDAKSKQLIWDGFGVRQADFDNSNPAINDIVLSLIDKDLITPSYVAGTRQQIRERYLNRLPVEYLMNKTADGQTHVNVVNDIEDGIKIMTRLSVSRGSLGESLCLNVFVNNDSDHDFAFDPKDFKVSLNGENLNILPKSKVIEFTHDLRQNNVEKIHGRGLLGLLVAGAYNGAQEHSKDEHNEAVDNQVKMVFDRYLDKKLVPAKGRLDTFAYITGFTYLPDSSKVIVLMPLDNKNLEVDYTYVPNWMSEADWEKYLQKYKK